MYSVSTKKQGNTYCVFFFGGGGGGGGGGLKTVPPVTSQEKNLRNSHTRELRIRVVVFVL